MEELLYGQSGDEYTMVFDMFGNSVNKYIVRHNRSFVSRHATFVDGLFAIQRLKESDHIKNYKKTKEEK